MNITPGDLRFDGPPEQAWPELALRFALSFPEVSTAVIGTTNPENARANLRYASMPALDANQIAKLRAAFRIANPDGSWLGQT
jgi:aryl-alcohol dehydrogenase-like predicted oxidoreductase